MPRILVVGSANVDFTVALARLPGPGETVSDGTLLVARGGKGANQAVAARRLGAEVRLVGCVGDDASGREVRRALADEGIDVQALLATREAATGTALIVVDAQGRNQIAVAPGANRALTVADVDRCQADFAWAEVVVCSLEVPLAAAARAAAAVRTLGATHAILTLGERGALATGPQGRLHAPAIAVAVVDTTGAGDAFNGALAVALAERRPLAAALRFANVAAALACTRRGAQPSMPTRLEVDRLAGR